LSVLGFFDALKEIGEFRQLLRTVLAKIEEVKPEAVILVDFSGFNLRLAKKINKRFKTIYYISPQVWASRRGRVRTIKKYIDKMLVIFEFEKEFYAKFGIEAEFIGHPLLDIVKPSMSKEAARREFNLKEESPVFVLLPGSRTGEVKRILPIMLKSARLIQEKIPDAQFIISKPSGLDNSIYESLLRVKQNNPNSEVKLIVSRQYDCLNIADFVLVCSGTATLETAIMQKPNVIIYKMGLLNYLLYRPLVKIPFIGMENIVAGKLIAPEFIQFKAKPKAIALKALEIFRDKNQYELTRNELAGIKEKLGRPQGPLRAAKSVLALINSENNG
ncbi:MAG: lipid-A-disaccharide synthase, partial [Candidatus Omnitrophota bacterium]